VIYESDLVMTKCFRRATKCSAAAADRKCGWFGGAPHFVRRRRRESVLAGGGGEIRRLRGLTLAVIFAIIVQQKQQPTLNIFMFSDTT